MNVDTLSLHNGTFTLSRTVNTTTLTNNHTGEAVDVPMGTNLTGHSPIGLRQFMMTCGLEFEGPRVGDLWMTYNAVVAVVDVFADGCVYCMPLRKDGGFTGVILPPVRLVKLVGVYPPVAS